MNKNPTALLIRPLKKLDTSVEQFNQHGIGVIGLALLDTVADSDEISRFNHAIQSEPTRSTCIFVSTAAADIVSQAGIRFPEKAQIIAVGTSTQKRLKEAGLDASVPKSHDTEGLLALPEMLNCSGKQFYLVKGHGGRVDLAKELKCRGANVTEANVYSRQVLSTPISTEQWQPEQIKCIIATSGEQVELAFAQFEVHWLASLDWIVVSERVKQIALDLGAQQVQVSNGASDEKLIGFLKNSGAIHV